MNDRGYTLIELVVVITILAILAALALPRFVSLQRDARIAKLSGVKGAVAAGTALTHAAIITKTAADAAACPGGGGTANNPQSGACTLCTENGVVSMTNSYPSSTAVAAAPPGIIAAAGLTSVFSPTAAQLTAEGYTVTVAGNVTTIQIAGSPTPANCSFTYTQSTAPGAAAVISAITNTGC